VNTYEIEKGLFCPVFKKALAHTRDDDFDEKRGFKAFFEFPVIQDMKSKNPLFGPFSKNLRRPGVAIVSAKIGLFARISKHL
jgi:hypothetical protein